MRKYLLHILIIITGLILLARVFYLQIIDTSYEKLSADNAIKIVYDYPQRGFIFDRNGELLVSNQPSYDVMVVPRNVKPFDTLEFCRLLSITEKELVKRLDKAKIYSPRLPSVIVPQMKKAEYAYVQEKMRKFPGFYIQKRSLRDYQTSSGANYLGYIAEVNQKIINDNPYYISGDLIGKQGVEEYYEEVLRGVKGVKYIQKDRFNADIGPYKDGIFDTLPVKGKDLTLTIDTKLQEYGELLMQGKRGGIVAIEPKTGEILSLITAPSYDPALLVGRQRSENFTKLYYDTIAQPLYDRALLAEYPPGSPFKTMTGVIALEENVVDINDRFSCHMGFYYSSRRKLGCHSHPQPLSLIPGIAHSCNSYFGQVYLKTIAKFDSPQQGMDAWKNHLASFGLGDFLGYDLPTGKAGKIPSAEYYNAIYDYPTYNWYGTATISNAIGQGEVLMTPIQLANMTAIISNRGWFYTPHILKTVEGNPIKNEEFTTKKHTTISPENFDPIIQGMHDVYNYGTAAFLQVPGIEIGGKTGTAENFIRVDGKRMQLTDHSIFVAFAPVDDPKIAIAVFVENGYWGSRYAGRIASLMIEKYLKDTITRTDLENWILTHSLQEEYAKPYSGKPFKINQ
ncbi:MAG TPA: penicillin-binding protein 2 [Salinimicrobium sp.]|nr:penicillin-binding protein 2 [Salinimicrobium sp.]